MKRSDHAPKTAKGTNPVVHLSFGEHWNLSASNCSSQCNSRKNAKCTKRTAENPSNSPKPFVRTDDALCYTTQRINSAHSTNLGRLIDVKAYMPEEWFFPSRSPTLEAPDETIFLLDSMLYHVKPRFTYFHNRRTCFAVSLLQATKEVSARSKRRKCKDLRVSSRCAWKI